MPSPVRYTRKVRYSDTDSLGYVFNGNYFVYFDDGITDYLGEVLGAPVADLDYFLVLARAECDFRSPGELGQTLVTAVRAEQVGNTSLTFALEVTEAVSGRLVARGREIVVVVDAKTRRPVPVPEDLRAAIARFEGAGGGGAADASQPSKREAPGPAGRGRPGPR